MCIFGGGNAQRRQTDASVGKYCFCLISAHYPISMITSSALIKGASLTEAALLKQREKCAHPLEVNYIFVEVNCE